MVDEEPDPRDITNPIATLARPLDPAKGLTLIEPVSTTKKLKWLPGNKVMAVEVTNGDTAAHAYLLIVEGF